MSVKEKFRATLDYDPERGRYYVSIKFYESGIPEEILVAQKAEADYLAKKNKPTRLWNVIWEHKMVTVQTIQRFHSTHPV